MILVKIQTGENGKTIRKSTFLFSVSIKKCIELVKWKIQNLFLIKEHQKYKICNSNMNIVHSYHIRDDLFE